MMALLRLALLRKKILFSCKKPFLQHKTLFIAKQELKAVAQQVSIGKIIKRP